MSNRKQLLQFLVIGFMMVFAWGCKKTSLGNNGYFGTDTDSTNNVPENVYIAGYIHNANNQIFPVYWNNYKHVLMPTDRGEAKAITVSGNDIYLGGYINNNGVLKATIWKNGITHILDNPFGYGCVNDVKISNGSVYAAGYFSNGGAISPVYWKDSVQIRLSNFPGHINSITIIDTDVYAGGDIGDKIDSVFGNTIYSAALWKNGNIIYQNQNSNSITSTFYEDNKFYFLDGSGNVFMINSGVQTLLTNTGGATNHIFVKNGNTFVTGYECFTQPLAYCYPQLWINGTPNNLSTNQNGSRYFASALNNNEVFIVGYDSSGYPSFWNNSSIYKLDTLKGVATSIFIK